MNDETKRFIAGCAAVAATVVTAIAAATVGITNNQVQNTDRLEQCVAAGGNYVFVAASHNHYECEGVAK